MQESPEQQATSTGQEPSHESERRGIGRRGLLQSLGTGTAALLVAGAFPLVASAASNETAEATQQARPSGINVVLVHGLWADASCYSRVIPLLQAAGHTIYAPQLPLTAGIAEDVTAAFGLLQELQGPTVLVGHSYGGAIITQIGTMLPHVIGLVYASAIGPDLGEPLGSFAQGSGLANAVPVTYPNNAGTFLVFPQQSFRASFAADVDPAQASLMAIVQKPANAVHFTDAVTEVAWKTIPSWYLLSEQDLIIPPSAQHNFANRMHATVHAIPSSHASIVSHPVQLVELIEAAIKAGTNQK